MGKGWPHHYGTPPATCIGMQEQCHAHTAGPTLLAKLCMQALLAARHGARGLQPAKSQATVRYPMCCHICKPAFREQKAAPYNEAAGRRKGGQGSPDREPAAQALLDPPSTHHQCNAINPHPAWPTPPGAEPPPLPAGCQGGRVRATQGRGGGPAAHGAHRGRHAAAGAGRRAAWLPASL